MTIKALHIIDAEPSITSGMFAERMWPDSPQWKVAWNVGHNGSVRGLGMPLAGGSFIGRLVKRGLIDKFFDRNQRRILRLTDKGRELIK